MSTAAPGTFWRHKKRQLIYEIITDCASIQCSSQSDIEANFGDDDWTVYRSARHAAFYVRPTDEFLDGRFEQVADENGNPL